ncbi:hypothetical protein P9112_002347 [Eukaryota sp. TZLM1-RC]
MSFQIPVLPYEIERTSPKFDYSNKQWEASVTISKESDSVSVFLSSTPYDTSTFKVTIKLVNHNSLLSIQHSFNSSFADAMGFNKFATVSKIEDPVAGFVKDGYLTFNITIEPHNDSLTTTLVSRAEDSRQRTGYVGCVNLGATCYMNSLLQSLFHTNVFRKAVFSVPIEEGTLPHDSIPLALQRLFFKLQFSNKPCSTKELTTSFGWTQADSFVQHDAQELDRVLCDKLENKMKGTDSENTIAGVFEGEVYSYIKCLNVDYESSRVETFYDLSLDVKGCSNIQESFMQYTSDELLEGENQYMAEGHGLQDAKKGCKFRKLPPVLHCHLKRFEYDFMTDMQVKVNDRYEFYPKINLAEFMDDEVDAESCTYILHSVLVHSGDVNGGHYYAYIKPSMDTESWFKFDDDVVEEVTEKEAIDGNFGGRTTSIGGMNNYRGGWPYRNTGLRMESFSSAYMLVYVRETDYADVMGDVTVADIPSQLFVKFKQEQEAAQKKKALDEIQKNQVLLKIATEQDLERSRGLFELIDWDSIKPVTFKKTDTVDDVIQSFVQSNMITSESELSVWKFESDDGVIKPSSVINRTSQALSVVTSKYPKTNYGYNTYNYLNNWNTNYNTNWLWDRDNSSDDDMEFPEQIFDGVKDVVVECAESIEDKGEDQNSVDIPINQCLLIVENQSDLMVNHTSKLLIIKELKDGELVYRGVVCTQTASMSVSTLEEEVQDLTKVPDGQDISLIKELPPRNYELISGDFEFFDSSGIVSVQTGPADIDLVDLYEAFCQTNTIDVYLLDPSGTYYYVSKEDSLGTVVLDLTLSYDDLAATLIDKFDKLSGYSPNNILFYPPQSYFHSSSTFPSHFACHPDQTSDLKSILSAKSTSKVLPSTLYLKALPFDREMEPYMRVVSVNVVGVKGEGKNVKVFVQKDCKGSELRRAIKGGLGLSEDQSRPSKMIVFREFHAGVSWIKKFEIIDEEHEIGNITSCFVQYLDSPIHPDSLPILVRHMTAPFIYSTLSKGHVTFFEDPVFVFASKSTTFDQLLSTSLGLVKMSPKDKSLNDLQIRVLPISNTQPSEGGEVELKDKVLGEFEDETFVSDHFVALQHKQPIVNHYYRAPQKGIVIQ